MGVIGYPSGSLFPAKPRNLRLGDLSLRNSKALRQSAEGPPVIGPALRYGSWLMPPQSVVGDVEIADEWNHERMLNAHAIRRRTQRDGDEERIYRHVGLPEEEPRRQSSFMV